MIRALHVGVPLIALEGRYLGSPKALGLGVRKVQFRLGSGSARGKSDEDPPSGRVSISESGGGVRRVLRACLCVTRRQVDIRDVIGRRHLRVPGPDRALFAFFEDLNLWVARGL